MPYTINRKLSQFILTFCFCLFLFLNSGCSKTPESHQEQIVALGTIVEIKLWDVDHELAHKASFALGKTMNSVNERWHAWQPSLLTQINQQLLEGKSVKLDSETYQLLQKAKSLSEQSEELFHPGLGNLISMWGFQSDEQAKGPPPLFQQRDAWLSRNESISQLILEDQQIRLQSGEMQLDLGGFAKGYAVDLAINQLKSMGIKNAIVNAGGDLRAIGSKGDQPWRIGVRDPRSTSIIASIELQGDESIFTSGDYERFYTYDGQRYHHLLDPRTAAPAKETTSITIIHHDATTADAAATALFIAGPKDWPRIARKMGIKHVMLMSENGQIYMTPSMQKRVYFLNELTSDPIIVTL